ncbi:S24/S26 family peptidase [bacterium]|nr:S24/S26 family peptidase [bacterium]
MKPLLRNGDFVLVQPWTKQSERESLRPGMMILFVRDRQLIVHRFLGWESDALLERGDRQQDINRLQLDQLLGVVISRKRNGKVQSLTTPFLWRLHKLFERDRGNL